jgi:hypothetical protein
MDEPAQRLPGVVLNFVSPEPSTESIQQRERLQAKPASPAPANRRHLPAYEHTAISLRGTLQAELDAHGADVNLAQLSVGDLHAHRRRVQSASTPAQKQPCAFPPSAFVKWRLLLGGEGVSISAEDSAFSLEISGTRRPKVRSQLEPTVLSTPWPSSVHQVSLRNRR